MKYLITGYKGFIGSAFLRNNPDIDFLGLDITDSEFDDVVDIRRVMDSIDNGRPDCIIHLAAISGIPQCNKLPSASFETNVLGTVNVLEAVNRINSDIKIILASSSAADHPTHHYGAGKACNEAIAKAYQTANKLDIIILRFTNVFGPFSVEKSSVVASFCKTALKKKKIYINGTGLQTRDLVHVDDICGAIKAASESRFGGRCGPIVVGSGTQISVYDIAKIVARITGAEIVNLQPRPGDALTNIVDINNAKLLLNYEPNTKIEKLIIDTVEWYVENYEIL
jgi:UDP-glucose 4-epimerase